VYNPPSPSPLACYSYLAHTSLSPLSAAFGWCESLTSVIFEPGSALLTIGEGAFREARVKEGIEIAVIQFMATFFILFVIFAQLKVR